MVETDSDRCAGQANPVDGTEDRGLKYDVVHLHMPAPQFK